MRRMKHSTDTPSSVGGHGPQVDPSTDEAYVPHFRSLTMPGLAKGPILPAWLSKLFRRKDAPAAP